MLLYTSVAHLRNPVNSIVVAVISLPASVYPYIPQGLALNCPLILSFPSPHTPEDLQRAFLRTPRELGIPIRARLSVYRIWWEDLPDLPSSSTGILSIPRLYRQKPFKKLHP